MFDFKKYPNEVILACLHDIAYEKGFYFYPKYFEKEGDWHNFNFYEMLQTLFNPKLDEIFQGKITKLKKDYTQDKKEFEELYKNNLITLENLMSEVAKLNNRLNTSVNECEEEYAKFLTIQRKLIAELKQFDLFGFNNGQPIVKTIHKNSIENAFVVTKDYITQINEHHKPCYFYCPEFKEKFNKLLGKTNTAEKTK